MAVGRLEDSPLIDIALSQEDADELYNVYPDLQPDYNEWCPTCFKNKGNGVDGTVIVDGEEWICNCKDQLQRYKHYFNAGIGLTYQRLTWSDYFGDKAAYAYVSKYLNELDENMLEGRGFVLFGPAGTGKTMLAALSLKAMVLKNISCYMTTAKDYIDNTKRGWNNAQFQSWYKRKIDGARVLVIDDLGKEVEGGNKSQTEFAKKKIENLIRVRTQQMRPTIVTTNMSGASHIEKVYGKYTQSLMSETLDLIPVHGSDARLQAGKNRRGGRIY